MSWQCDLLAIPGWDAQWWWGSCGEGGSVCHQCASDKGDTWAVQTSGTYPSEPQSSVHPERRLPSPRLWQRTQWEARGEGGRGRGRGGWRWRHNSATGKTKFMKTQLVSSSGSHVGGKGMYTVVACTFLWLACSSKLSWLLDHHSNIQSATCSIASMEWQLLPYYRVIKLQFLGDWLETQNDSIQPIVQLTRLVTNDLFQHCQTEDETSLGMRAGSYFEYSWLTIYGALQTICVCMVCAFCSPSVVRWWQVCWKWRGNHCTQWVGKTETNVGEIWGTI